MFTRRRRPEPAGDPWKESEKVGSGAAVVFEFLERSLVGDDLHKKF